MQSFITASLRKARLKTAKAHMQDLPTDRDIVKLTCVCNDDVTVENFGRVYGYSDTCAAFLNKGLIVEIAGENLTLSGISLTVARVTGSIHSITYTLTDSK